MKNVNTKNFMEYLQEVKNIRCRDITIISDNHIYFVLQYKGETFGVIIHVENGKLVSTDVNLLMKFRDTKITENVITLLLDSLYNEYINKLEAYRPMPVLIVGQYPIDYAIKIKNLYDAGLLKASDSLNGFSNDKEKSKQNTMLLFNKIKNINTIIDDVADELLNVLIKRGYSKLEAIDIINNAKDITDLIYPETLEKIDMYLFIRECMCDNINKIIYKNKK